MSDRKCICDDPDCLANDPRIEAALRACSNTTITRRQIKEILDAVESYAEP